jgi:hypothetical protein
VGTSLGIASRRTAALGGKEGSALGWHPDRRVTASDTNRIEIAGERRRRWRVIAMRFTAKQALRL